MPSSHGTSTAGGRARGQDVHDSFPQMLNTAANGKMGDGAHAPSMKVGAPLSRNLRDHWVWQIPQNACSGWVGGEAPEWRAGLWWGGGPMAERTREVSCLTGADREGETCPARAKCYGA